MKLIEIVFYHFTADKLTLQGNERLKFRTGLLQPNVGKLELHLVIQQTGQH